VLYARTGLVDYVNMAKPVELEVHLAFDAEAAVWYVAKTEIPGLSLEAETPMELLRRIVECAPELIELNSGQVAEVVDVRSASGAKRGKRTGTRRARTPIAVRPVFDSPYQLACA
jgi:hypothetical protein